MKTYQITFNSLISLYKAVNPTQALRQWGNEFGIKKVPEFKMKQI